MSADFDFAQQGRSITTALVVAVIWVVLGAAVYWLQAAWWVVGILALFTVPAVLDLIRNPGAALSLTDTSLRWRSGRRSADLLLTDIDHIRMDTRLDFSVRVTAVLHTGRKIRLPFECTPPSEPLEEAFAARGITTKRQHFTLTQ